MCIIDTPKSCFEAAKEHLESAWPASNECAHYLLTFHFTPKISKRPDMNKWKSVHATHQHMHSIMNTGKKLQVNVREVMCMWPGCLHGDLQCKQPNYIDEWKGFNMENLNILMQI